MAAALVGGCLVSISDSEPGTTPDASSSGGGAPDASSGGGGAPSGGSSGIGGSAGAPVGGAGGTAGASGGTSGGTGGASGGTGGASGGTGGASGGTGGASGTGGGTAQCLLPISDDFADGVLSPSWYTSAKGGMSVAETGGELVFTWPASSGTEGYTGLFSKFSYDISACALLVRVAALPLATSDAYIHFAIGDNVDKAVEFYANGYGFWVQRWDAGVNTYLHSAPFDWSKHRWWRFRGLGEQIAFDVSGDGKAWTTLNSAQPFSLKKVWITLGAGYFKVEPAPPGTAAFDDLNLPP
jgi:hypothetical protein